MHIPTLRASSSKPRRSDELIKDQVRSCQNVDMFMQSSDRLKGTQQDLALFHRHEIEVGSLVGAGSFSEVYEITSFGTAVPSNKKSNKWSKSSAVAPDAIGTTTTTTTMDPVRRRRRNQLVAEHEDNTRDQNRYVIKQLHSKLLSDPKLFRRAVKDMATEAKIMSRLTNHPHIAHLRATAIGGTSALENGQHNSYFLVLDRLVETLEDRIVRWNQEKIAMGPSYYLDSATNDAKMDLKTNYAWQIASALDFLHQNHIIFRDLKPQNSGFKTVNPDHPEQDVVALFDFGLSRTLPAPEQANEDGLFRMSMVGTRRYMAPEIVTTRTYNAKVDTYAWGLVFYELVSQQRPYDGMQRGEHKQYICIDGKRPKLYSYYGLPAELERLIRLSWAQDVSQRVTMAEVCRVLENYLAGTIHENAVQEISTRSGPSQDASVSSLLTGQTEQTESTEESLSFEEEEGSNTNSASSSSQCSLRPAATVAISTNAIIPSDVSEARADVAETVPQAISVSASTLILQHDTRNPVAPEEQPTRRHRLTFCERITNIFRYSVRMFC
ncbi:Probable LIM domain-containing serine/threonine-protein kinase DDB [Seminavis robusta]|uniref:Probable LIM domain-containing serine/threonine-protein kinase DDB n=1 Tax=Seminavis robusta TaxID=568900 RepID=A0A9N8E474_9STRA|nr:Probable LIM domain-containing serine/threonine-protein kinase DDB [Seminavis robusta]|eukprot:Sro601_g173600.1 Probable LIM domain-containing serine/threonine-protein kinase DDB (552) ;mRNA; f:45700-47355